MTAADQVARCEVCRVLLADDRPRPARRRCTEHLAQHSLFPLTALRRPRGRSRKATP